MRQHKRTHQEPVTTAQIKKLYRQSDDNKVQVGFIRAEMAHEVKNTRSKIYMTEIKEDTNRTENELSEVTRS